MKNLLEHFPIDGINNLRHSPTLRNMEWLGYECCEHLLPEESISVEEATVVERTNGGLEKWIIVYLGVQMDYAGDLLVMKEGQHDV